MNSPQRDKTVKEKAPLAKKPCRPCRRCCAALRTGGRTGAAQAFKTAAQTVEIKNSRKNKTQRHVSGFGSVPPVYSIIRWRAGVHRPDGW